MTSLTTISRELYREYNAIEASAKTPEELDVLIDENSAAINLLRDSLLKHIKHVQKSIGIGALCAGAAITLAVALPSIPTIILGVVAAVALVILGVFFEGLRQASQVYSDERKMNELLKNVVLNTSNEKDIDVHVREGLKQMVFKNNSFA